MDMALHESQGVQIKARVFFTGTTVLLEGQGVCYERDYAASTPAGRLAADPCGYRAKRVELPNSDNNMAFAGVATENYPANAKGQWIDIYEPGSTCYVLTSQATTVGATVLTAKVAGVAGDMSAGWFGKAGFPGRGSALALQTLAVSAGYDPDVAADKAHMPVFSSLDGSTTIHATTKSVGKTAMFTYGSTTILIGDRCILHAGVEAAAATAGRRCTPGIYDILTRTSANAAILTTDPNLTAHSMVADIEIVRGYPKVLAYLMTGEESGLTQWVVPVVSAETVAAAMSGGTTFVLTGGVTITAGETLVTVANPTNGARRKSIVACGTSTTKGITVTPTSSNITCSAVATVGVFAAISTFKILLASGHSLLEWNGAAWCLTGGLGTAA